jgi:hypothetical protein
LSTLSLTIEKHFCGDVLIDVAIFTEVQKCSDDGIEDDHHTEKSIKKSCCKDEIDVFEGLSETTTNNFEDLNKIHKQILFAYASSYIGLFEVSLERAPIFNVYHPPILVKDIQVLYETYLI